MSLRRTILSVAAPVALLLVGGCAQPFRADVARFQRLPAPQGQTFYIVAQDPHKAGGIEFSQYAAMVAGRLTQQGYQPAVSPTGATLLVTLDYAVDNGHEKVVSEPGGFGYGPGFGWGGGFGYGRGFGRGFYGSGWYGGWGDPFWAGPDVHSYTYYVSHLSMKIRNRDGAVLFEGRAKARSVDDRLPHLVPNLIEAMFTGFPGRSGEDLLITVPPPGKPGQPTAATRGN